MQNRLRKLFPISGLSYELFNTAVLVVGVALCWYLLTPPSQVTSEALASTLSLLYDPRVWGAGLCTSAVLAGTLAYFGHRATKVGYIILIAACGGWSFSLLFGALVADVPTDVQLKAFGSALLFAWMVRHLLREVLRTDGSP